MSVVSMEDYRLLKEMESRETYRLSEYDAMFLQMLKDYSSVEYNRNNMRVVEDDRD